MFAQVRDDARHPGGDGATFQPIDDDGTPLPSEYRQLREGIERFFITDINNPAASAKAQSEVPIMFDAWGDDLFLGGITFPGVGTFNHVPGGCNVLYVDGHVEFVKMGEKFPIKNSPAGTYGENLSSWIGPASARIEVY